MPSDAGGGARDYRDLSCLTEFGPQRPMQADRHRAVGTEYQAMFHCLTRIAAVMLMGEAAARLGAKCVALWRTAA